MKIYKRVFGLCCSDNDFGLAAEVRSSMNRTTQGLPKSVRLALARGLAKNAEERFATCGDFAAALEGKKVAGAKKPLPDKKPLLAACAAVAILAGGLWGCQSHRQQQSAEPARIVAQQNAEEETRIAAEKETARIAAEKQAERERQRKANGLYRVIDLTDGTVTHLDAVPSGGWTDEYKTRKLVMRRIEPGTFTMGSPAGEEGHKSNENQHRVTLTKPYYMGVFEVTQGQWERVMGGNPSNFKSPTRPVEQVDYDDIRGKVRGSNWPNSDSVDSESFLGKLRTKTGMSGLDLPTEAQWEYACRAGTTTALPNGKALRILGAHNGPALDDIAWYGGNSGVDFELSNGYDSSGWKENQYNHSRCGTHPVGMKRPNAWGLYDTIGNVWEWCLDWYNSDLTDDTDPTGPASGVNRVVRGGSWFNCARACRSVSRGGITPGDRGDSLGFRLCGSAGPYE